MFKKVCLLSLTCLVFSGCASNKSQSAAEQKYHFVNAAAHQCTEDIRNKSAKLSAEGHSLSVRWTTVQYVVATNKMPDVEYGTSSILDNGVPGSAWKSCMQSKDALVPELKL